METISLPNYDIMLGDCLATLEGRLGTKHYSRIVCLVDENTKAHCLSRFNKKSGISPDLVITTPSGEKHKNLSTCQKVWKDMLTQHIDRNALVVILGGGVLGDMGGFCASTFKRGVDFVQVPTSLLSMVDSSIGSKLGIDFQDLKNVIGVFRDPLAVMIDPDFLMTLPERHVRNGFAETMKHALIADADLWQKIIAADHIDLDLARTTIKQSLKVKQGIVSQDPFEKNIRKSLNFGHTLGHAIESHALRHGIDLLHGEAIALGMIGETHLSSRHRLLDEDLSEQIAEGIRRLYTGLPSEPLVDVDSILAYALNDKKNEGSSINCTLLSGVGSFEINRTISAEEVKEAIEYIRRG